MTDSMKFGPEWLRNMAQDGGPAPTSSPRYQLAEHRYGREEMLALFDTMVKAPDPLASFPGLYVDKTQVPLALIQMTEEETRHWNRGINSDAVLRAMGKAPPPSVNPTLRGTGRGGPVGPGGLSDRGRGRGRGGFTSYPRGLGHEEGGDVPSGPPHLGAPPGGYTRGTRPFDRSQSDRGWGERNGLDSVEWGSTSPRKDFSTERDRDRVVSGSGGTRGYSGTDNNWRRHRTAEDDEGWRTMGTPGKDKWGGAGTGASGGAPRNSSWREGDRERDRERDGEVLDGRGNYGRPHRPWEHSNLPEWAVDGADSSGGSFDAQGAFHGGHTYSDEEEDRVGGTTGRRTRLLSEGHSGSGRRSGAGDGSPSTNHSALRRNIPTDRASAERASERLTPYVDKQNDARVPSPSSPPREGALKGEENSSHGIHISRSDHDLKSNKEQAPSERIKTPENAHLPQQSKAQQAQSPQHPTQSQVPQSSPQHQQTSHPLTHPHPLATSASMPALSMPNNHQENHIDTRQSGIKQGRHKSEDAMDRMQEVADDIVAKLMEDEEGPLREDEVPSHRLPHVAAHNQHREPEKWLYRDPQGQVQGPFSSEEMMEWFRSGYFNLNLLVRRAKDERFSQLQDLIKVFGGIPFITDANVPPIKANDPLLGATPILPAPGVGIGGTIIPPLGQPMPKLPVPGMPNVPNQDMLMAQHQFLLQQQQQLLLRQQTQAAAVVSKLSQTEGWATLSQLDQQQLVAQHIQQLSAINPPVEPVAPFINAMPATSPPNPVLALITQIQQKQQQQQTQRLQQGKESSGQQGQSLDPIQQLIQQMGGLPSRVSPPNQLQPQSQQQQQQPPPQQQEQQGFDPIQSLMRQLGMAQQQPPPQQQQAQQPQQAPHQVDSLWGSALPVYAPGGWLAGVRPQMGLGVPPGGQLLPPTTASLWGDITTTKEMKTEKQILEEQMSAEEERKEQMRKKEEEKLRRQAEEEASAAVAAAEAEKKRKKAEEAKRKEEEARHKEEQRRAEEERKKQEEMKKHEAARKKEEEKKKKEEDKKRKDEEKERKKQEEEERKRHEEDRQRRAREEEQARKAEAQRQQAEAVRKSQEQQRQAQEAAKNKAEQEEQARRIESQRQQAEALRKMQEQQQRQAQVAAAVKTAKVAPWSQPQAAKPVVQVASLSLAEIQRNQKRENYEQMREQQMILQQIQQQNQQNQQSALLALSLAAAEGSNGQPAQMQLKWAERKPPPPVESKTLEQIQREEQERVAKQLERDRAERAERAASVRDVTPNPTVGIWGSANQSLTWGNSGNSGPGFWDEVTSPAVPIAKPAPAAAPVPTPAPAKKNTPVKSASTSNMASASSPAQAQSSAKNSNSATKKKKEEATVLKLFEQTVQRSDEFSQWCHKALASLNPSVDIPTFVGFLRDVESPYEVKDYVRLYLGEGEAASDFARHFLERRSKWRSEHRSKPAQDDMCAPAPAINPAPQQTSHDFQEVKGKGKKAKKGKMYKVDSRILGFSVTAAPDRINVGDRDYGEGI